MRVTLANVESLRIGREHVHGLVTVLVAVIDGG